MRRLFLYSSLPHFSVRINHMNTLPNIFLIGLMGAGKTTIGKQLALELKRPFYDSDHIICERTGVSIPTIFELEGEEGFRLREMATIDELTTQSEIILATGGGAVMRSANRQCLKQRGITLYLHTLPHILLERTRNDKNRPLLQVDNPLAKLQELYNLRDPIYRNTAHHVIDANQGSCQKTVQYILQLLT